MSVEGIRFLNSPCWNTFFVRTNQINFDRVRIDAFSTNASVCISLFRFWGTLFATIFRDHVIKRTRTDQELQSLPKNTDGFDTYDVKGLTVTNTEVNVGDDCFSPKSNTSDIFVQNLWCNGTHGVSMGSIGQYPGVLDYIEDAYMENVTMLNGQVR